MAHELGVTEPAIGYHHGWGQGDAAPRKGGQPFIDHLLGQMEFVLAFAPRAFGIGAADGKIHRDDEFAIANDHKQEHAINAKDRPLELATVPAAHESEVLAVFSKHGIIDDPSPLPTTLGGGTLGLGMTQFSHEIRGFLFLKIWHNLLLYI